MTAAEIHEQVVAIENASQKKRKVSMDISINSSLTPVQTLDNGVKEAGNAVYDSIVVRDDPLLT